MGEPSWRIVWVTDAIPAGGSDQVWLGSIQLPPVATRARHRAATPFRRAWVPCAIAWKERPPPELQERCIAMSAATRRSYRRWVAAPRARARPSRRGRSGRPAAELAPAAGRPLAGILSKPADARLGPC